MSNQDHDERNEGLFKALEAVLQGVAHIAQASAMVGLDRVHRLQDARVQLEEAAGVLEKVIIEAEYAAGMAGARPPEDQDGHPGDDGDGDGGSQ